MSKNPSPKTDAMRAAREAAATEREKAPKRSVPTTRPIDDLVNEATETDPNGRGGKAKINVPKKPKDGGLPKTKAQRDNFPVPPPAPKSGAMATLEASAPPAALRVAKRATQVLGSPLEGRCANCRKLRAVRNGVIITHSWPPPTRQVCSGSGQPPVK